MTESSPSGSVRLAELVAALSIATDFGMGQPVEFAMRSCILAVRLGESLGMSELALREVYYQALLRYIGCNAETHLLAALVGDEIAFRKDFAEIDNGSLPEIVQLFVRSIRQANQGASSFDMMRAIANGMLSMSQIRASFTGHCEVAQRLATRLGFDGNVIYGLGQLYERWDGKGAPHGIKGEAIAPAVRVVTLAQDALIFQQLGGIDSAISVARQRSGSVYEPRACEVFCEHAGSLFSGLEEAPSWEAVLALEPGDRHMLSPEELDRACAALADFVDLKSRFTLGHSSAVAALCAQAASISSLPASDVRDLHRAGLLHDLGRTGVSSTIWDKPGTLSTREWDQVRLHPYYTERILSGSKGLARLGTIASLHHERLDGSGYHRGLQAGMIPSLARILAAADVFQALTEDRPHRPARSPQVAAAELQNLVRQGKLDRDAAQAVTTAAGLKTHKPPPDFSAGLSEREVEVLRLVAQGLTTRQVAETLVISAKTADHHIQNIYTKIGVSTRAGATLFAMEHHLIEASSHPPER